MIRDYIQVMHFCDLCVDAAGDATDDEGRTTGAIVLPGKDQAYFLIQILCGEGPLFEVPRHRCESNNGYCDCGEDHEDDDEEE